MNTDKFIGSGKIIYGEKFTYDKSEFINHKTKIVITCPEHGDFERFPNNYLKRKQACRECGKEEIRINNEIKFIEKSNEIHDGFFTYDNVKYIGSNINVIITCPIHGDFEQKPRCHASGDGCPKCADNNKLTIEDYFKRCNEKYDNGYIYDFSTYKNTRSIINITCTKHGIFYREAWDHMNGAGCPECNKITNNDFIEKANKIHGDDYYIYDKVNYVNNRDYVTITCTKHGDFKQIPNSHLRGSGCPKCHSSLGENKIRLILNNNNMNFKEQISFDDLKYISTLYFDFAILNNKGELLCLIEFNGIQHYEYCEFFHNKNILNFHKQIYKDELKYNYCSDKSIPLFIIKYDENIKEKLDIIISNFS